MLVGAESSLSEEMAGVNGDMRVRATADTGAMEWTASPAGQVLRKRLHLVGEAESGQVTSLVRYLPGARFPEHDHPEGEEILVLEGTFSDHDGDAMAGTHLLNPEGHRHAPYSEPGCLLLVKLRQYAGDGRPYRRTQTDGVAWTEGPVEGIDVKTLFADARFPETTRLERWSAGAEPPVWIARGGREVFVLEGAFEDEAGGYGPGTWLRLPDGAQVRARSRTGCLLYAKEGAVAGLRST